MACNISDGFLVAVSCSICLLMPLFLLTFCRSLFYATTLFSFSQKQYTREVGFELVTLFPRPIWWWKANLRKMLPKLFLKMNVMALFSA
jgi:hypothetical protein